MAHVKELVSKKECCGCGACYNKCPHNAIKMQYDDEGFLSPVIDLSRCTNCSQCVIACPALCTKYDNTCIDCYIAISNDEPERLKSSSGGVFSILARKVLAEGGYVAGTVLNKDFLADTIVTNNIEDLEALRGSKYMQSNTLDSFRKIEALLKRGIKVLYCSTPCQIAGLKTYLKKDYSDLLITIDLMCHGGSSPKLFTKYLEEFYPDYKDNLLKYSFRDKSVFGWKASANLYYKNNIAKHINSDKDYWYKSFGICLNVRECCGTCKYARVPRIGDFTLGDFWKVRKVSQKYSDGKGTSFIFVNNDKSRKLLTEVKDKFRVLDPISLEKMSSIFPQPINRSNKAHPARSRFFRLAKNNSFEKAYNYAVLYKYDVGIVGLWNNLDFGAVLSYFALYRKLEEFKLSSILIEPPSDLEKELPNNHSRRFARKYMRISKRYALADYKKLNNNCDTFLVGSDQIWNYGISKNYGKFFYLNFVDKYHKKISFGTSFGHEVDFAPKSEQASISYYLESFDAINVRETEGVNILKNTYQLTNTNINEVLDPVFLVSSNLFKNLAKKSKYQEKNYTFLYILDFTDSVKSLLTSYISRSKDKKFIFLSDIGALVDDAKSFCEQFNIKYLNAIEVEDFVSLISNADAVITDSYQGTCFSMIFKKSFLLFKNLRRGVARIDSLNRIFNISESICTNPDMEVSNSYLENFERILNEKVTQSNEYLKHALFDSKEVKTDCVWKYSYKD